MTRAAGERSATGETEFTTEARRNGANGGDWGYSGNTGACRARCARRGWQRGRQTSRFRAPGGLSACLPPPTDAGRRPALRIAGAPSYLRTFVSSCYLRRIKAR